MATKTTYTCDFCKTVSEDSNFLRTIGVFVSPDGRFNYSALKAADCVMKSDICPNCVRTHYDAVFQANQTLLKAKAAAKDESEKRIAAETYESRLMRIFEELVQDCISNTRE
jgi:hypothetical protein